MPLLDDLDPAPAPKLTDLDPGQAPGLLNDLDPEVDARKARNARVQVDQQLVGLAHTPASDSAAARREQLATGKAFDASHPIDPVTAAQMRGEPTMQAFEKPNPVVTYAKALGLGAAKGLTKMNRALRLNAPFERSDSGGQSDEDYLKSVLDSFETASGPHPLPGREASASIDSAAGWNPDGAGTIIPSATTVEGVAEQAPTMALSAVPVVGPELYAATTGEETRQEGIRQGMDPQEALARGAAAALGGELGFRAVPGLKPELAKLSPVQDVAPAAAAGGKGSFTGRLAEGALMGEAGEVTTPNDGQPRDLSAAAAMAAMAAPGGRVRGPVHYKNALDKVIADGELTYPAEPVLGDLDPSAHTQTDLRPVAQGPETQEFKVFQKGEAPGDVLERDDTPEERAADLAASQAKLDAVKRIRSTGSPVVGGTETREIDPLAVKDAIDTEDRLKTQVEGAPDRLMQRNQGEEPATRVGDTQDNLKTQAEARPWPSTEEPDYQTHMTREVTPSQRAYMDALSDNIGASRVKREKIAEVMSKNGTRSEAELAPARDEFNAKYPEVAFGKPGDELNGHESPLAPPEENHAEPAQPAPARAEAPAPAPEPKPEGRASSTVTVNGREGVIIPGAPKGSVRVRFTNGKHAVVPEEIVHETPQQVSSRQRSDAGHVPEAGPGGRSPADEEPHQGGAVAGPQRENARPAPEGAPEGQSSVRGAGEESGAPADQEVRQVDRGGVEHALRGETPEARRAELQGRRQGPDLHEGKTVKEVENLARKRVREDRGGIVETIRQRHADGLPFQSEEERRAAQIAVSHELHQAVISKDRGRIAEAQELARQERAVASKGAAILRHSARNPRDATPHERHEILHASVADAHENTSGLAKQIASLEKERDALRAKLGPHADAKAPEKAPFEPNKRRSQVNRKKAALNEDFKALAKSLARNFSGKGPSSALGGRVAEIIYQMLKNRVAHGALSFADAVLAISDHVLAVRHNADAHEAMDAAWKRVMAEDSRAEAPEGTASEILENDPRNSLEKRLERMDNYYKKLEEHYQDYHDQLAAMTPEARAEFLAGEASKAELPPELQKLREDGAARLKTLREKIKAIDGSKGKAPSLQEQLDEEGRRQANLHGRLEAERQRLAGMTPEELQAEAQKRRAAGPHPAIAEIRKEAADRRAPLLKQLDALRNPDKAYKDGATNVPMPDDVLAHQKALGRVEKKLRALKDADAKKFKRVTDRMARRGFPMNDPDAAWLKDPTLVPAFLDDLDAVTHGGVGPVLGEIYRGMLHASSTVLQMKGITDVVNFASDEFVNLFSRTPGETWHALKGWAPGVVDGFWNALGSIKWERDRWADRFDDGSRGYEGTGHRVIGGVGGRIFRLANLITPVAALNAFASSIVARMEQGAQAYRMGKAKGLKGDALAEHMKSEGENYHSESWEAAKRVTDRRMLLQKNALSKVINQAKNLKTDSPALNAVVRTTATITSPFSLIPLNNLKEGFLTRTPILSTIGSLYRWKTDPDFRVSKEIVQNLVAYATAVGVYKLATGTNSFGLPYITGFADEKNPHSFYYDGHYRDYSKFGPWAHGVGNMVDIAKAWQRGKPAGDYIDAAKKHITEEALFKSLADINEAFSTPAHSDKRTRTAKIAKYAANLTTSFIPSYVKQFSHATEDHVEKLTNRDPNASFGHDYIDDVTRNLGPVAAGLRTKLGLEQIPFQYDTWGEPLLKDAFEGRPQGTFLYRVAVPSKLGDNLAQKNRIDFLIADYNEKHTAESDQIALQPPDRSVREGQPFPDGAGGVANGKKYDLTDPQVEEALKTAGPKAKDMLLNAFAGKKELSPTDAVILKRDYNSWIEGTKKLIAVRDDESLPAKAREHARKALDGLAK